eukprot:2010099-Heterocapsa_arctica.AAC.1
MKAMSSDILLMIWCFSKEDTEEQAITGLAKYLTEAKQHLTNIGQMLNDKYIFVQNTSSEKAWHRTSPDYKGR